MRRMYKLFALLVLAALALGAAPAKAQGRHFGGHPRVTFGFSVGVPLGYYYPPPYYYAPYYYAPYYYPPVVVQSSPPVYVERSDAPAAQAQDYWYYCADARMYYPYVKQCPGGWQRVNPQPTQ